MIPRILHRIWFGPPMPDEFAAYGELWRQVQPEWTHLLWTEGNLGELNLQNHTLYEEAPKRDRWRWRADIVRLEVLWRLGGVYVDTDSEPLKPLDTLLDGVVCFVSRSPNRERGDHGLTNSHLGCTPGHPFFEAAIQALPESVRRFPGRSAAEVTGPRHLERVYQSANWPDVDVFPSGVFAPQSIHDRDEGLPVDLTSAYAWHRYATTRDKHWAVEGKEDG